MYSLFLTLSEQINWLRAPAKGEIFVAQILLRSDSDFLGQVIKILQGCGANVTNGNIKPLGDHVFCHGFAHYTKADERNFRDFCHLIIS